MEEGEICPTLNHAVNSNVCIRLLLIDPSILGFILFPCKTIDLIFGKHYFLEFFWLLSFHCFRSNSKKKNKTKTKPKKNQQNSAINCSCLSSIKVFVYTVLWKQSYCLLSGDFDIFFLSALIISSVFSWLSCSSTWKLLLYPTKFSGQDINIQLLEPIPISQSL